MEADEINKEKYYEKDSYNIFDNFSIHGLNIEGIKRYYSIPVNKRYYHMIKLNKDLDQLFKKYKKEKEIRDKNIRNNRYDDERIYKMYANKNEENNKNLKNKKSEDQKININIIENTNEINKNELRQKLINTNSNTLINELIDTNRNNMRSFSNKKNSFRKKIFNGTNISYSLRKFNKKLKKNKEMNLPLIKPREILIEYQLTNGSGFNLDNKNLGHNGHGYMGGLYNPYNYTVTSKNRTKRNVFGGLFVN